MPSCTEDPEELYFLASNYLTLLSIRLFFPLTTIFAISALVREPAKAVLSNVLERKKRSCIFFTPFITLCASLIIMDQRDNIPCSPETLPCS